ncbi:hypothetical protein AMC78_CH03185 [Rhizobium phaseoli]|uniref:DUF4435 domain-containing protein n=1 Tax=Rhizobium phaseoli TaxID=396 RepID=UPI0007E92519|nr:DUF4435 domain-containing protein [Rhizobium phaseoli]ANM05254.1 hypothetical protein AMC78_CH03185 [Rhizobium phaseoli]
MVGEIDEEVQKLIEARGRSAVLKAMLITSRSKLPNTIILAFEGPDDKLAFSQWISRLRPGFVYEPLTCKGKRQVLQLHDAAVKDKARLADGVYFFVDRDFDDLMGFKPSDQLFMTEEYSIENTVVHRDTLENLLKNEFHCDGAPDLRAAITAVFDKDYADFLTATRALNERLFLAKQLGLDVTKSNKLKDIAKVELKAIAASETAPIEVIKLPREPAAQEASDHAVAFAALDRIRGIAASGPSSSFRNGSNACKRLERPDRNISRELT